MNERSAMRLLRRLISHEGGTHESGRADPGWCCSEHAFIASLAFTIRRKRTLFCEGELIILKREVCEGVTVSPHFFLVDDASEVFDSSISYEDVEGIPTNSSKTLPHIKVLAGKDCPSIEQMHAKLVSSAHTRLFCYTAERPLQLGPQAVEWVSDTPFGLSLTDRFGSQAGLWSKAAWFVAEALKGVPPALGGSQDAMWDVIAGSAERDQPVVRALRALQKK